jgi:hypothetical protein
LDLSTITYPKQRVERERLGAIVAVAVAVAIAMVVNIAIPAGLGLWEVFGTPVVVVAIRIQKKRSTKGTRRTLSTPCAIVVVVVVVPASPCHAFVVVLALPHVSVVVRGVVAALPPVVVVVAASCQPLRASALW